MTDHFQLLHDQLPEFHALASGTGAEAYFGQEVLRFHSIAGSNLGSFQLDASAPIDERYITHVLTRSLIEGYFWIIYIFDDLANKDSRYEELVNSFKLEYLKFFNEKIVPGKADLEPADPLWSALPKALDARSMMSQVKNEHGDRLDFLYLIYRIASFDTHGKSLNAVFKSTFGKEGNFPFLKIREAYDLMANQYLVVLQKLVPAHSEAAAAEAAN